MKQELTIILSLWLWNLQSQSTLTYTVDQDFSTGTMLSGIGDLGAIYPLEGGGFFLGGTFNTSSGGSATSPFDKGLAMVTASGGLHPEWDGVGIQRAIKFLDHDGGYIIPESTTLAKITYSGDSWFSVYGETWGDYYLVGEFGSGWDNPYEVNWTWDIYIEEDESVIIAGAIATDTLQPEIFRHLMRLNANGSHDDTFPIIEADPYAYFTYISRIDKASDGSWYVSGRFEGINGHYSPHIVHLTPDFQVDTDFVSPFVFESIPTIASAGIRLLDDQDRLWVSGRRVFLEDNPSDTLSLVRLLPNGEVDASFQPRKLGAEYPDSWGGDNTIILDIEENQNHPGHYFLAGTYSHYDDTLVNCITVVDDHGYIQDNYYQWN